jgi:hypothetical protein
MRMDLWLDPVDTLVLQLELAKVQLRMLLSVKHVLPAILAIVDGSMGADGEVMCCISLVNAAKDVNDFVSESISVNAVAEFCR